MANRVLPDLKAAESQYQELEENRKVLLIYILCTLVMKQAMNHSYFVHRKYIFIAFNIALMLSVELFHVMPSQILFQSELA